MHFQYLEENIRQKIETTQFGEMHEKSIKKSRKNEIVP